MNFYEASYRLKAYGWRKRPRESSERAILSRLSRDWQLAEKMRATQCQSITRCFWSSISCNFGDMALAGQVPALRHVGGLGRLGDCRPATSGTPGEGIGIRES
eukprot:symbB.v1.2.001331.t1/scaffold57.1/size370615/40